MPLLNLPALTRIRPGPDEARSLLERELSRPAYQRGLLDRFQSWLGDLWAQLTHTATTASPVPFAVTVVLLVLLGALLVAAASRVRREPSTTPGEGGVLGPAETSPEEHRSAALSALEEGRSAEALVEAFRALAARSVRRGLLDGRPGLTAHELADELAPAFPAEAASLSNGAALFDLVFYGEQPAAPDDARSVLDLDERLRSARPAASGSTGHAPGSAVPR